MPKALSLVSGTFSQNQGISYISAAIGPSKEERLEVLMEENGTAWTHAELITYVFHKLIVR